MKWLSVFSWFTYCYFLLHSWHLIVLGNIFCSWISPKIHVHWCAAVLTWRRIQFMPLMLFDLLHVFIYILIDLFIGCGRRWSTVWLEKWWSLSNCLSLTVTRRRAFSKRFFDFSFRERMSLSYCLPEFFRHLVAHKTVPHKFSYRQWCKSILVSVGRAPTSATEPLVQLDFESRTICRRTSDIQTCHADVSDSRWRHLVSGTNAQCDPVYVRFRNALTY